MSGETTPGSDVGQTEALLKVRLGSRVYGLRVLALEGGVVLQGIACSYHVKQLAQQAVMETFGLKILANEIEVRYVRHTHGADGPDPG